MSELLPSAAPSENPAQERIEAIRDALLVPATPAVTYTLIGINVGVFALQYLGIRVQGEPIDEFLALRAVDLAQGGWNWVRLFTCCFVHGGILHILMNMYALYILGPLMERIWGRVRFLALYFLAGLGGSCAAIGYMPSQPNGALVSLVGASGAIWGLMGAFAIWVFLNRKLLPAQLVAQWRNNLLVVFVLNVVISLMPGISAAAHFGGGGVGAICAGLFHFQRYGSNFIVRLGGLIGLVLLPVICVVGLLVYMNRAPAWAKVQGLAQVQLADRELTQFNAALDDVSRLEEEAMTPYLEDVRTLVNDVRPDRREDRPDQVVKAQEALTDGVEKLKQAEAVLQSIGPFQDQRVEQARQARLALIQARLDLFNHSRYALEVGEGWKPTDETKMGELRQQVREAESKYRSLVPSYRPKWLGRS